MTTKIPVELSSTPSIVDNGDATAITIDSSENVGIGLTNPSAYGKLALSATATQLAINASSGKSRIGFFEAGTGRFYIDTLNGADGLAFVDADGSTERMRILAGGGLTFNGDTATANALDDYEEGIHIATITCGTSGTVSLNGAYSDLSYTKVGRLVTVTGFVIVSSVSSPVGYYTISLPFTCANLTDRAADSCVTIMHHYGNNAKPSDIVAFLPESSSEIHVYRGDVGVTRSETSAEELRASTQIMLSVTYNVA